MFGKDEGPWEDYDLSSAYSTVLFKAGDPDYGAAIMMTVEELEGMSDESIINSYIIMTCTYEQLPALRCKIPVSFNVFK